MCTMTNDDKLPQLQLLEFSRRLKTIIGEPNKGTDKASKFNIEVSKRQNSPLPSSFKGLENGSEVTLGPGRYIASKTLRMRISCQSMIYSRN
jgi:hypothetical protein